MGVELGALGLDLRTEFCVALVFESTEVVVDVGEIGFGLADGKATILERGTDRAGLAAPAELLHE